METKHKTRFIFAPVIALTAILVFRPAVLTAGEYPITIRGGDDLTFSPEIPGAGGAPIAEKAAYDTVVVGGGLAGLTAAIYLSDTGKTVLLIEKEASLGGLAAGDVDKHGIPYNRGGAYLSAAYEEEGKILEHIGLGDLEKKFAIHEPSDSYLWKGRFYEGVWEPETLGKLPASFALFKHELEMSDKDGLIPGQPMEEAENFLLDQLSAAEWIKSIPQRAAARTDDESRKIYELFSNDASLDPANPMKDMLDFAELYTRSSMGGVPERVSAAVFANFYIAEFAARYTNPNGTGMASMKMVKMLQSRKKLVRLETKSTATKIINDAGWVRVQFLQAGKLREVKARYAVFAAQLRFAPKIIAGLTEKSPEQENAMKSIDYSDCFVHVVRVKGHPYRATYDTWIRAQDYKTTDPTDVILGRWMDPKINGYKEMRDFKKNPADNFGIFTVYHGYHHPAEWYKDRESLIPADHFRTAAKLAVDSLIKNLGPLLKEKWGTKIEVQSVETNSWPFSMHVAKPGYVSRTAKILRKPFGRVFFANNNLGTPSVEEALFRGHCAANNILHTIDPEFQQEPWSRCPLDSRRKK